MPAAKNVKSAPAKAVKAVATAAKPAAKPAKGMPVASGSVPTLVKVISVLYYIGAALSIIMALVMFFGAGAIDSIPGMDAMGGLTGIFSGLMIVLGVIMIGFAVLAFFIARGLWKGRNWARIVAIILAILGVLSAIISLVQGSWSNIIGLIIHGAIGGYLLFSKDVKAAFA